MATLNSPKLLLLDEHTSALDPKIAKQVMEITHDLVRKHKTTTMMITHNLNHAINYGNRLLYLRGGEVVLDVSGAEKQALTPASLVTQFI